MSDWWLPANEDADGAAQTPPSATDPSQTADVGPATGTWDSTAPQPPVGAPGSTNLGGTPPASEAYQPVDLISLGQPAADVGTVDNTKRSKLKSPLLLGSIAAGLLVLGMGAWAAFQFFGGSGAGSPEEVLTTMADAVNAQDPVLAATVVDPDELPMLVELMTEFEGARERSGLGGSGPVKGTELEVTDLDLDVDELAPNVARVTLTDGELSASYDLKEAPAPVQAFVDNDDRDKRESGSVSVDDYEDEVGAELSAIVVKKGRGWYVSPSLTTADLLVEAQDDNYKSGDFDGYGDVDFFAEGAESPAAVLEELSDAVASGDPEEVAAQLPSDQGQAAVVFQDAAEQFLANELYPDDGDAGTFDRNRWEFDRAETHTEKGPNGTTRLVIDSGKASVIDTDGQKYDLDADGWKLCSKASGEDRDCLNVLTGKTSEVDGWGSDAPLSHLYTEVLGESPSLLMREVDGGWKLDPVATLLDLGVSALRQLDQNYVESIALQPVGDADVTLTAEQDKVDLTFNDAGFTSVAVPTEPDGVYSVVVDDVDPNLFAISNPDGYSSGVAYLDNGGYYDGSSADRQDGLSAAFIATDKTTVLGFGGPTNSLKRATARIVKVKQAKAKVGDEVQGSLDSPLALYRLPAEIGTNYELEFAASKETTIDVMDGDGELDSYGLQGGYSYDTISSSGKDDTSNTSFSADWSESLVVVRGEPGTSFSFRVTKSPLGFEGGSLTKSVFVPGDNTIEVPFDLSDNFSTVGVDVSWTTNADIDPALSIGGLPVDSSASSESYCPCSNYLVGSGSTSGSVSLQNYDSFGVTVLLELTIE